MADHRAEQVLAAVLSALDRLDTPVTIGRDHAYSYDESELPALNVTMGTERPGQFLIGQTVDWELDVEMEIAAKAASGLAGTINQIRKEIHVALRADPTLGLSFVLDTLPGETAKPEQKDGDLPVMAAVATWTVTYRSSLDDPSA